MIAAVLYRAINRASNGAPLTGEQRLTLQWLRAEARVEREVAKRARIRAAGRAALAKVGRLLRGEGA